MVLKCCFHLHIRMKYVIAKNILDYFANDALKNKADKKLSETFAFGIGQLNVTNDTIVIEELIFPTQTSTEVNVEDTGMNNENYFP